MKTIQLAHIVVVSSGILLFTACGGGNSSNTEAVTSSITHNGVTYGFVTSPFTGKVWLDKNLGAARVCESQNDDACYGDYYQWGRGSDGHENSLSATSTIQADDTNNPGNQFIIQSNDWTTGDNGLEIRFTNWSKTDGTSVCPVGFRVPTEVEINAETANKDVSNVPTAFSNFLKLPASGSRNFNTGNLVGQGSSIFMWTGLSANVIAITANNISSVTLPFAFGFSVRCIKN